MKTLYLLRHAKSDWGSGETDFDRPLNARGRAAAVRMGAVLADEPIDRILCSPAIRTRQTLELLALPAPVTLDLRIYEAGTQRLFEVIAETDDRDASLLLVGHMPAIAGLAIQLASEDTSDGLRRIGEGYPTAALAKLNLDIDRWRDLGPGCATVDRFLKPRELD